MDVARVERELASYWRTPRPDGTNVLRACSLNLIVVCTDPDDVVDASSVVAKLSELHPCRALVVTPGYGRDVDVKVSTHGHHGPGGMQICCEQVTIEVPPGGHAFVPQTLLQLLVGDLPVVTWWRHVLAEDDPLFAPLAAMSDRLVVYTSSAPDPAAALLGLLAAAGGEDRHPVMRDLTWVRLDGWREMVASFFDVPGAAEDLIRIVRVAIVGGGAATPNGLTVSAAYMAGWLAARLGWKPTGKPLAWIRADDVPVTFDFNVDPPLVHGRIGLVHLDVTRADGARVSYRADRLDPERKAVRMSVVCAAGAQPARVEHLNVVEPHALLAGEIERDPRDPVFLASLRAAVRLAEEA